MIRHRMLVPIEGGGERWAPPALPAQLNGSEVHGWKPEPGPLQKGDELPTGSTRTWRGASEAESSCLMCFFNALRSEGHVLSITSMLAGNSFQAVLVYKTAVFICGPAGTLPTCSFDFTFPHRAVWEQQAMVECQKVGPQPKPSVSRIKALPSRPREPSSRFVHQGLPGKMAGRTVVQELS